MKSSASTKLLLALALVLLFAGTAGAEIYIQTYEHDAGFDTPFQETRACSCGTTTDYFTLENQGDFTATYDLTLQTDTEWVTLHRNTVTLGPDEKTLVPVTLTPPCETRETTSYTVYATSEFGRFRAADRTITAHACENIGLSVDALDTETLPCTQARFDVTVKNTATFEERYELWADDENVELETRFLRLEPGEQETVRATTQYACDVHGQKQITFTAASDKNDLTVSRTAQYDVLWDYDYVAEVQDVGSVCAQVQTDKAITITNTASTQNTYDVTASGDATTHPSTITVQPGATETVSLRFAPDEKDVGSHETTVSITPRNGDATKEISASYNVKDCYEHRVEVTPEENTICAGEGNYTVQVQNRGLFPETFALETSGDIFNEATPSQFTLRPGEHVNALLRVVAPDQTRDYDITVTTTQSPGVSSTTTVPVKSVSNADCTLVTTASTQLDVYTDADVVPFIITNEGVEAATYDLSWDGKLFSLQEDEVFLAPGEQAVLHLKAKDLKAAGEGEYVERFLLVSDRAEYRHDFHVDLNEKSFAQRAYERVFGADGTDWCLFWFGALILLVALAAIIVFLTYIGAIDKPDFDADTTRTTAYVLGALALLLVLLGAVAAANVERTTQFLEEPAGTNASQLFHEFPMNEDYTVDLSQYFVDPDGDELAYSASQPEHLTITIEGDTATLDPDRNWYGVEPVVFTATDPAGNSVDSPIMTVRVLPVRPLNFWGFVATYCWTLDALLLALLLGLGALYLYTEPDEELEEHYGKPMRKALTPPEPAELEPVQEPETSAQTHVGGDVIAGDKVMYAGFPKETIYVASKGGTKLHDPECPVIQRVPKEKRVIMTSKEQALGEGYSPCKTCRPFNR